MSKKRLAITISVISIIFLIVGGIAGYFGYYYYTQYNQLKTNPQLLAKKQTQEIVSQVGGLMRLPTDEIPQLATVVNPALVQAHTPFSQAETGDVILIYTKMKRAILYRPSSHKIIDVAPVILDSVSLTPPFPSPHSKETKMTPTPTGKSKLH